MALKMCLLKPNSITRWRALNKSQHVTSLFDALAMRKQLLDALRALIPRTESKKQPLGRWSLKTCDELATGVNAVYQNRDHCGDVICKTPKRATDYIETNK